MPLPPVDRDSFDKVNFVIDAWTTGCDAPWYIYIETMKPALLAAFITLITFGWDDALRGAFRPKGLGRRTGKRKGKFLRKIPRLPETGDMFGKALPIAEQVDDFTSWNGLGKTLWRIDTAMQAAMFWWLVAEVTEDFAFEWTSLLYESYWCQPDPPGKFSYRKTDYQVFHDNAWTRIWFGTEDYEEVPPEWLYYSGASGAYPCTVAAAVKIQKHAAFPPPTEFSVRIIDRGNGTVYGETGPVKPDADGNAAVPVLGHIPARRSFEVNVKMTGTPWAWAHDGVVVGIADKN